jgi:hypothetical protein
VTENLAAPINRFSLARGRAKRPKALNHPTTAGTTGRVLKRPRLSQTPDAGAGRRTDGNRQGDH